MRGVFEGTDQVPLALRHKVLLALVTDDALRRAAHDLAQAAVLGVADGVPQANLDKRAADLVTAALSALQKQGDATLAQLLRDAGPQLEETLRTVVEHTLVGARATLREGASLDLKQAVQGLVRVAVQTFFDTAAQSVDDLSDPVARFTTRTLAPAAGQVARVAGHEAVAGALEEIDQKGRGATGPLHDLVRDVGRNLGDGIGESFRHQILNRYELVLTAVAAVLACLLIFSLIAFFVVWGNYRRSAKALAIIAEKINSVQAESPDLGQKLKSAIRESTARNEVETWLSAFLKQRGR